MQYRDKQQTKARKYLERAGYPTGDNVQALGPKPEFSEAQKFTNKDSWEDPTPPTKA